MSRGNRPLSALSTISASHAWPLFQDSSVHHPTKRPNKILRRKQVGKSLVYLERYYVEADRRFYVEALGPDYRIWKRTEGSEDRAVEIYQRYRFWVWWIEACCNWMPATRFFTWVMHKTI